MLQQENSSVPVLNCLVYEYSQAGKLFCDPFSGSNAIGIAVCCYTTSACIFEEKDEKFSKHAMKHSVKVFLHELLKHYSGILEP